jgi:leader peptidase (prepilin peptidase)/N-methyltransferase
MILPLLLFIYGLLLGSFYNVVGLRVPINQSIVAPRSACPRCHHRLTAVELIPVFSFLNQRGKCRKCGTRISPLYPFVELMTAVLFLVSLLLVGWNF